MDIEGWAESPCKSCTKQKYPELCQSKTCEEWAAYFANNWNLARLAYQEKIKLAISERRK